MEKRLQYRIAQLRWYGVPLFEAARIAVKEMRQCHEWWNWS